MKRILIKDKESFERFKKSVHADYSPEAIQQRLRSTYWYCFGWTPDGQPIIFGPKNSEAEVTRLASEQNLIGPEGGEPIIVELPTVDQAKAVREIKAMLLERGVTASIALKRVRRHR
jgi:hypothetical protein